MSRNDEGYIIETYALGGSVKVTAIDPATGTEATIVGSPKATADELAQLAVRKLHYILGKRNETS